MIEKEMEDLIATYPDDFFPDRGFRLKGRQQSFAGVGRFDLLFEDRFQNNILMELKAVAPKYDVVAQITKYKEELHRKGETRVWMWIVAPQIPMHVRELLDQIGIEYREIHAGEFRQVAERHGVVFNREVEHQGPTGQADRAAPFTSRQSPSTRSNGGAQVETGPRVLTPSHLRWRAYGYDLQLTNPKSLDRAFFSTLIDGFEGAVPSQRNGTLVSELRRWAANPDFVHWAIKSNQSLLRWVTTSSYKGAVPHALAIWAHMFGQPAPTWYVWTQSRGYEFDAQAWRVWYDSLQPTG